jgi:hypothetical protein
MIRPRFQMWFVLSALPAVLLPAVLVPPELPAETIAIVTRHTNDHEGTLLLVALVEQGAMEFFFQAGHIVFNLPFDPDAPMTTDGALEAARDGGASHVVLLDLILEAHGHRGSRPRQAVVILLEVATGAELERVVLDAATLDRVRDPSAQAIAERLGSAASEAVAGKLGEGGSW